MTFPPRRTATHRIDTEAVRVVRTKLTADWVERSVEDRDYGIDMMLEAFDGEQPTGILVLLQIKGHAADFGDEVSLSVPVKTLLYAQMFQNPFILVNVSVGGNSAYFVWIQKYINTRLFMENRRWDRQESVTIHFPKDNVLDGEGLKKIRGLVTYVAHRDAGFTFLAHLVWLKHHIEEFHMGGGKQSLEEAIIHLGEISRLERFLDTYDEAAGGLDLECLSRVLKKAKAYGELDYGDDEVVDAEITKLKSIELMFLSKHEIDAFVSDGLDEGLPY